MFETPLFEWAGRSFGISRSTQLNSDIATRYTNAFTEYPSDVLGTNGTLKILTVDIPNGTTDSYSPPVNRTGNRWFNVLTFGRANRCTQIACYSFLTHNSDNKVWIRTQHDNSVSAWKEL